MKIVIPLVSASQHLSGVQRHAINLTRSLLTRREIEAIQLIVAPWQMDLLEESPLRGDRRLHVSVAKMRSGALGRNAWYYLQLPQLAREFQADIVHLAYPMPLRRHAFDCPVVVSLHDLYPYDIAANFGPVKAPLNRMALKRCLRSADAIACVSASTLLQLKNTQQALAYRKATVVPNCVEPDPYVASGTPPVDLSNHPFLLSVAQHRRNKNLLLLLKIFARLRHIARFPREMKLLIVGIEGPETKALHEFIYSAGLSKHVQLACGLPEPKLQWSYRNCEMLLAPSSIEGFGLPVAEALLAGCRVICSDIPALREVGQDYCRYIPLDANVEGAFAEAILESLSLERPKPIQLPLLSASAVGASYFQLYRSLLLGRCAPSQTPMQEVSLGSTCEKQQAVRLVQTGERQEAV